MGSNPRPYVRRQKWPHTKFRGRAGGQQKRSGRRNSGGSHSLPYPSRRYHQGSASTYRLYKWQRRKWQRGDERSSPTNQYGLLPEGILLHPKRGDETGHAVAVLQLSKPDPRIRLFCLAGGGGIEPPTAVLETAVMPLN